MFQSTEEEEAHRTITLSRKDLFAARRLLRLLIGGDQQAAESLESALPANSVIESDRGVLIARARDAFENRRRRIKVFGRSMFGEAAWDMLLALYVLDMSGARQTVGDVLKLAGTPMTTANRWLGFLVAHGFVRRDEHPTDARTAFITLTETARSKMDEYFSGTVRTEV